MTAYIETGGWNSKGRGEPIGSVPPETSLSMWLDNNQYNRFLTDQSGRQVRCDATTAIIGETDGYLSITMGGNTGLSSVTHKRRNDEDPYPWRGYHPRLGPISIYPTPQEGTEDSDYPPITLERLAGERRSFEPDQFGPASHPS